MAAITLEREQRKSLQKALNEKMRCIGPNALFADGAIGPKTVAVLKQFQLRQCIEPTGSYDLATASFLQAFMDEKYLTEADYVAAARDLDCELEAVKAVKEVEAKGSGFLPDGRGLILFERHIFYKELAKKLPLMQINGLLTTYPNLVSATKGGYLGDEAEWKRLEQAKGIARNEALLSASLGLFQIMGFNYKACGFATVEAYWDACQRSERDQLKAFVAFVKANPTMHGALRTRQWRLFAEKYNGPAQKGYDQRMASAYAILTGH